MNSFLFVGMFDIGGPELLLIVFVTLMLFGAKKLPEMMRNLGRSVEEFKRAANNVRNEVMNADLESPAPSHLPPPSSPQPMELAASTTDHHPATTDAPAAASSEVAPETSKAEITLNISTTPPPGTVSQNEPHDHDEKPAQQA